ncbi:MAG: hypothetical protein QG567_2160, partial [Campylobacterota bacterium]|nr:hypothetical protein [Campylobacterota bacterium]
MSNKIGFNNFKAFGSQMQYFSQKPITLIYGPNSVGKSSLLHSQLYLDYLRKTTPNVDLFETYFAGDKLDLGGFRNFLHKHDTSAPIVFEFDITKKEDLHKLLGLDKPEIKLLQGYGFQEIDFSIENLDRFLNQEFDYKIKMSQIISQIEQENRAKKSEKLLEQYPQYPLNDIFKSSHHNNLEALKSGLRVLLILLKDMIYFNNLETMMKDLSVSDEALEIKYKEEELKYNSGVYDDMALEILDGYINTIRKSSDIFTQCIILSGESKSESIKAFFDYLKYLYSIDNIKIKVYLEAHDNKINTSFEYFVNDEILFNTRNNSVNKNHPLFECLGKALSSKRFTREQFDALDEDSKKALGDIDFEKFYNEKFILKLKKIDLFSYSMIANEAQQFNDDLQKKFSAISDLERLAYSFINYHKSEQNIQYYGPLRFYPERFDLNIKNKKAKKQKEKAQAKLIDFDNIESIFNKKPFLFLRPSLWKIVFASQGFYDAINNFLPEKSKISSQDGSSSSQQMWDKLIQSKEMQDR